jgi:hypothetical protein
VCNSLTSLHLCLCPHAAICVSSYTFICVLSLLMQVWKSLTRL